MIILLVVIGIALGCGLMGAIVGIMIDRWIRETEQLDKRSKASEERAAAGRHARTQPRTSLVVPKPSPLPWYPLPGPGKPQAGRDSGAGTETMDRLTTTGELAFGELRANAFIASLVADEEAHRLETSA